jgi:hypothetical protein
MIATGVAAQQALATNGQVTPSFACLGTTQATAAPITTDIIYITSSGASTSGAVLPNDAVPGDSIQIMAASGISSAPKIYPPLGGTINGGATNAAINMTTSGSSFELFCLGPLTWVSVPYTPS